MFRKVMGPLGGGVPLVDKPRSVTTRTACSLPSCRCDRETPAVGSCHAFPVMMKLNPFPFISCLWSGILSQQWERNWSNVVSTRVWVHVHVCARVCACGSHRFTSGVFLNHRLVFPTRSLPEWAHISCDTVKWTTGIHAVHCWPKSVCSTWLQVIFTSVLSNFVSWLRNFYNDSFFF